MCVWRGERKRDRSKQIALRWCECKKCLHACKEGRKSLLFRTLLRTHTHSQHIHLHIRTLTSILASSLHTSHFTHQHFFTHLHFTNYYYWRGLRGLVLLLPCSPLVYTVLYMIFIGIILDRKIVLYLWSVHRHTIEHWTRMDGFEFMVVTHLLITYYNYI